MHGGKFLCVGLGGCGSILVVLDSGISILSGGRWW